MKKLLLLVLLSVASPVWSQTADTVLLNGKVLAVDTQFSIQEAIAVREGKIVAVGKTGDVRRLVGPRTRLIEKPYSLVLLVETLEEMLAETSSQNLHP